MTRKTGLQKEMFSQIQSRELFEQAKSYAYAYMNGVYERNVFPTAEAIKNLRVFDESLPAAPGNPGEILRLLHEHGSPATVAQTARAVFWICEWKLGSSCSGGQMAIGRVGPKRRVICYISHHLPVGSHM